MSSEIRLPTGSTQPVRATAYTSASAVARSESRTGPGEPGSSVVELPQNGKPQEVSEQDLPELVEKLSGLVQSFRRELEFSLDKESGRTVIKVRDTTTGEVIRQIPPEEVLTLVGRFEDLDASLLRVRA